MTEGLTGWRRWAVERRLWAYQLYGAALIARETGDRRTMSLLLRSLAHWPLPTFFPVRYKVFVRLLLPRRGA
jgi:hypothetical protein